MHGQHGVAAIMTVSLALKLLIVILENRPKREVLRTQYQHTSKEDRASAFSLLSFWWLNGLLLTGFKKALVAEDLFSLGSALGSIRLSRDVGTAWKIG